MRHFGYSSLSAILLIGMLPSGSLAQTCFGAPSLATSSGNVRASADFTEGVTQYGAGLTIGSEALFFGGGFSFADADNSNLSAKTISASVGAEFAPSASSESFTMCPTFAIGRTFGLEVFGVDVTSWQFVPALAFGYSADVSPTVSVVPAGQISLVHARVNADAGVLGEASDSDTSGVLAFGLGFLFNQTFAVGPRVMIPLDSDNGDTAVGIIAGIAFGN